MSAQIIDGKSLAAGLRKQIRQRVNVRLKAGRRAPGLAVILVGNDPASEIYVHNKRMGCEESGILSFGYDLPSDITQERLFNLIDDLNDDPRIDGILVQLPLPAHIDTETIIERIRPDKDVDGFHPYNVGRLVTGNPLFQPCTPYGVMKMLEHTGVDLTGKEVVVVGRSNIVGKPVALMCLAKHATVTLCHSRTRDLAKKVGEADVLIAAVGRPEMIKGAWIKEQQVVVDGSSIVKYRVDLKVTFILD